MNTLSDALVRQKIRNKFCAILAFGLSPLDDPQADLILLVSDCQTYSPCLNQVLVSLLKQ